MANINIPKLMDDELLISYICRIAEENGMPADTFAMYFVHNLPQGRDPNGKPLPLSPSSSTYIPKLASVLGMDPLDLFMKTSLYPGVAPLTAPGKQMRIINSAFRDVHQYPNLIQNPHSEVQLFRYCPICAAEDMSEHGFSWLRRAHHMPGVNACWLHGTKLRTAKVNSQSSDIYMRLPIVKATPADDIEIEYAAFAGNFLNADFDLNIVSSSKLITSYTRKPVWMKDVSRDERDKFHDEVENFSYIARKLIGPRNETYVLIRLFTIFRNAHNIPSYEDEFIRDCFVSQFSDYELVSGYHANGMTMRKRHGGAAFVTTAMGFLLGWRDPANDTSSEAEKYSSIIDELNDLKEAVGLPLCEKSKERLQQSIETNVNALYRKTTDRQIFYGSSYATSRYKNPKVIEYGNLFSFLDE